MNPKLIQRQDLQQHLSSSFDLDNDEVERLMEDLMEYFDLTMEEFVQLRHRQLQRLGLRNIEIYRNLQQEIRKRRFKAPSLSLRQIRRLIYG